jgi:hypothetical protein
MRAAVAPLDFGQRVVSSVSDPGSRISALNHVIDRVCVERCFSYANYEPSTAQFRLRARAPNPVVAHRYADSWAMQTGTYVPQERDLPLYQVDADAAGNLVLRSTEAGARLGVRSVRVVSGGPYLSASQRAAYSGHAVTATAVRRSP